MKLDENVYDIFLMFEVYECGCMDVVVLKFLKYGGFLVICCVCDMCYYFGVKMCVEDIWGSDIMMVVFLYLVVLIDLVWVLNICDLLFYVLLCFVLIVFECVNGCIVLFEGVGFGIVVDV